MKRPKISLLILFFSLNHIASAGGPLLVGLTQFGGVNNNGTVLRYTGGDTSVSGIFSFAVDPRNIGPYGGSMRATDGFFYGLSYYDGNFSNGTLFKYDYINNVATTMVNLDSITGDQPLGNLLQASNGLLYGLTSNGGANNSGTLFSYILGDTAVNVLVNLPINASPQGSLMQASDGNLYGLTYGDGINSGGTIFQFNIAGNTYSPLYNLPQYANPYGSLLEIGKDTLYGGTYGDGLYRDGTLFKYYILDNSSYTVLFNFEYSGTIPPALVHATDGNIYGTTAGGGNYGAGEIFSYTPGTDTVITIHSFGSGNDGTYPEGSLFQASDSVLYGMTNMGGITDQGTIFSYNIYSATYKKLISLDSSTGWNPKYGGFAQYIPSEFCTSDTINLTQTICTGDTFYVGASPYTQVGNYTDTLTNVAGCDSIVKLTLTITICENISSFNADNYINLYPNPTNDRLFIKTKGIQPLTVTIYDTDGRMILTQPFKPEIDVNNLTSGVYLIETGGKGELARKIFVKI